MIVIMMIMIIVIIIINIIMSMGLPNTASRSNMQGGNHPTHTTPQGGEGGEPPKPTPEPHHTRGRGEATHNHTTHHREGGGEEPLGGGRGGGDGRTGIIYGNLEFRDADPSLEPSWPLRLKGGYPGWQELESEEVVRVHRRHAAIQSRVRYMPELLILIKGLMVAARSVFFTLVLLLLITYVFSIAFARLSEAWPNVQ